MRFNRCGLIAAALLHNFAWGQVGPASSLALASQCDVQAEKVPASGQVLLSFSFTPVLSDGGDSFDAITTDPSVSVSLILPNGTEITAANAAAQGFSFSTTIVSTSDDTNIPVTLTIPGTHTLIGFPPGQAAGTYQIKANGAAAASDSFIIVYLFASGTETFSASVPASFYRVGDQIPIFGYASDGVAPITTATITASIGAEQLVGGGSISNYQIVRQEQLDANNTQFSVSATFVNGAAAVNQVTARATSNDPNIFVSSDALVFGDLAANASATSTNSIKVVQATGTSFNSAILSWQIVSLSHPAPLALLDGGPGDAAVGDGIFTGLFTPTFAGEYDVVVRLTGTTPAGNPVSRTAGTHFTVTNPLATISSVQTSAVDTNGNGLTDSLVLNASINVQTAGSYTLAVRLIATNGKSVVHLSNATLASGTQAMVVQFSAMDVLGLGVDGPYTIGATLLWKGPPREIIADNSHQIGVTPAYTLASFDKGPIYFTGTNSATGIDSTGSGSFDILRIQFGVFAPAGVCSWTATLADLNSNPIDTVSGTGSLIAGNNILTLDFSSARIAQLLKDGPYLIRQAGVFCGVNNKAVSDLFQTGAFTASQFRYVAPGLAISIDPPSSTVLPGSSVTAMIAVTPTGRFSGVTTVALSGVPPNVTVTTSDPQVSNSGRVYATFSPAANATAGTYSINITGTSGAIAGNATATLIITVPDFALSFSPASETVAPSSQVNGTVTVTPANTFSGTVTLSASGLPAGAVASFLPSSVGGANPSTSTLNIVTNSVTPGSYPFTITGTSGTLTHSTTATLVVDTAALPYPWVTQGIGANSAGGSATHGNGLISMIGPGNNLNGAADSFQFTSQPLNGDGTLIARVAQTGNATGAAMAGIMLRETLDPAAANVFVGLGAGATVTLQSRSTSGGAYTRSTGAAPGARYWFKLVRAGNTFTAYTAPDGLHWTQQGTALTITMATSVFAGLALSSDTTGPAATAGFDHALLATGADFYLGDAQPASRTTAPNSPTATYAITVAPLNGFAATVTLAVTGLPAGATAGFSASSIVGSGGSLLTITGGSAAVGTYPLYVSGTSGTTARLTPLTLVVSSTNINGPADPWASQDIGAAAAGTGTTYSAGTYVVSGSGQQLTTSTDSFRFSSQALVGDGTILARITGVQNVRAGSSFGVMIRDSLSADAPYAAMLLVHGGGDQLTLLGRATAGATPTSETDATVTEPYWVKLVRTGNTFTGYASPDGATWTQVGTPRTIAMGAVVLVGLAVCSGDPAQVTAVSFDTVTISSGADFFLISTPTVRTVPAAAAVYFHTIKMLAVNGSFGSVNLSVAGVPAGVAASLSASTLSPGGFSILQLTVGASAAPGTYPITVTGSSGNLSHSAVVNLTVTSTGTVLPSPWTADDIGHANVAGSSVFSSGAVVIQASGTLNGTPDAFRFTYQALTGDGTILIRHSDWNTIWDTATVGVMIRESLLPDAAYAYARTRADVIVGTLLNEYSGFQYRAAAGGSIVQTETGTGVNPYWVKLVRSGNVFSGFISPDGLAWTQMGASVTINMPSTVFVGMAVSSGNNDGLTTAGFDSLFYAQGPDFMAGVAPASQTVPLGRGTAFYTTSIAAVNNFAATVTLSVTVVPAGATATFTPASINGSGSSTLKVVTSPATPAGTYALQVTGTSGSLTHTIPVTLIVDAAQASLPAPWNYDFIGSGAPAESLGATLNAGVYTLSGVDCCQGGTADTTFFAHQSLAGDGVLSGRIASVNGAAGGRAGLMLRNSLDPASPSVAVSLTYALDGVLRIDTRSATGGATTTVASVPNIDTTPYWLKLVRQGTQLTIFVSADGVQWFRPVLPVTINLAANTEAGLFASGGATFDGVSVSAGPQLMVSAFPSSIYSMNGVGGAVQLNVFPGTGTITTTPVYSISSLPANVTAVFADPGITDVSATSQGIKNQTLTLTASAVVPAGIYPLTVTATSGTVSGSAIVNLNVNPGFNISPARTGFQVSATPSGFYGAPHPCTGLTYSYSFLFDVTYIGGFASTVYLNLSDDISNPPNGCPAVTNPASVTATRTGVVAGTMADPAKLTNGLHRFKLQAGSGSLAVTQMISLEVGPDFSVDNFLTQAPAGAGSSLPQNVHRFSGLTDPITLSVSGFPGGITGSYTPNVVTASPDATTLNFSVPGTVAAGIYNGFLTGTSNTISHTVATAIQVFNFSFSTTQPGGSVKAGMGTSITGTLSYGTGGYPASVTFGNDTLPTGVTASFSPPSRSSAGTTNITITTSASTPPGTYTLNFKGTGNNLVQYAAPVTLVVTPGADFTLSASVMATVNAASNGTSTITVAAQNGFAGVVTLTAGGLPTGAGSSFSPGTVTGAGTSTLTVTTSSNTPGGIYTLTVTGTSAGLTHTINVTFSVKNFTLAVSPASQTASVGSTTAPYAITLTAVNGYNSSTTFTAGSGLPANAVPTFSPNPLPSPGVTNLTIAVGGSVPNGTYPFTITATSGSLVHTIAATLVVTPDFTIATSTGTVTVTAAGASATDTITIAPLGGFNSAVTLSVSGIPSGASGTFGTNPVTGGSGTSVLTLSATSAAVGGSYTVTVTGTSGSLVHSKTITLTIKNFSLTAAPSTISAAAGASGTSTVNLSMTGGFASSVTFGTTSLPTGAVATFSPPASAVTGPTTMTVTLGGGMTAGNYPFNIIGTSGSLVQSIPATLTVTNGFSLSNSGNVTVTAAGTNGTATITLTASPGLTGATALTVGGLPTNATASFNPMSVTGSGTSTLTFGTPATVAGGSYTITVTGTNGSLTRTTTLTLTVKNFSLTLSKTSLTVTHGGANGTNTVTVVDAGGFNSAVAFTSSGQGAGATLTFSPTPSPTTSTLTVSASSGATHGTFTITVTGTVGSLVQTKTFTLIVN